MAQGATRGGEIAAPFLDWRPREKAVDAYLHGYIVPVCKFTADDGQLILILNGQAEEWEARIGRWAYAADYAGLCRLALGEVERRIRSRLDTLEPHMTRLDAPGCVEALA